MNSIILLSYLKNEINKLQQQQNSYKSRLLRLIHRIRLQFPKQYNTLNIVS